MLRLSKRTLRLAVCAATPWLLPALASAESAKETASALPAPASAAAEDPSLRGSVKVKTLADGTRHIYNETPVQRQRRDAFRLLPVPADSGLDQLIARFARAEGLPPRLVQAVIQVESGYNPRALSNKGAMGLMQLMPETAAELGVGDAYDPQENVRAGSRYLRQQIQRFGGSLEHALAAYNAGPSKVVRFGGVPPYPETREYVARVLGLYRDAPPEWLKEQALAVAAERRLQRAEEAAQEDTSLAGNKVYVTRDANNRIVFTTSPPKGRN